MATDDLQLGGDALQAFGGSGAVREALGSGGADLLSRLARWSDGWTFSLDADPVLDWNQRTLDAIRTEAASPLVATRALAMEGIAVSVALDVVDSAPARLMRLDAPDAASAAVAAAAHRVLSAAFPAQKAAFDAALADSLAGVPDGAAESAVVALGGLVGDAVVALRARDGWNDVVAYAGARPPASGARRRRATSRRWRRSGGRWSPSRWTAPTSSAPRGRPTSPAPGTRRRSRR